MAKQHSLPTRIVERFLDGHLSVILILLALLAGAAALLLTPREEEPQIVVPIADVYVQVPGASAGEVEKQVATRLEKLLWQVDGVEYVYSMSRADQAIVTVRFYVGQDRVESLVKLHNKLQSNLDQVPAGVTGWVVKPVEVDDVPIVNLALYSDTASDHELRRVADEVVDRLQSVKNTSLTTVIGGRPRQVKIILDPHALAARGLALEDLRRALAGANVEFAAGRLQSGNADLLVRGGKVLHSAADIAGLVVGVHGGQPIYLGDVAAVSDGMAEVETYTRLRFGPAATAADNSAGHEYQAVSIAVAAAPTPAPA